MIRDLTTGPVGKELLRFSFPFMLSNALQTIYNLVDMVIVGQFVGSAGLSAVSIGGQLTWLMCCLAIGYASGGQIFISQLVGAGDHAGIRRTIGTLFTAVAGFSLLFMVLGIAFHTPLLRLLNTPPEAAAEAAVPAEGAEKAAEIPAAAAEPVPAPVMEEAEEAAPAEETVEAPAEAEEDLAAVAPEEPEALPAPAEAAMPYDLSGDPLTLYYREGEDWQAETRTGREAKYLCALMNIEELRPGTPGEPVCVIDFGNGTLAELYGPGDGGAIYTCPQGVSFTPDLLEDLRYQRELSVYDYVIFPEGTWEEVNREE